MSKIVYVFSIIAMYLAVVLLVGRLIRGFVTNAPLDVIISEIPNPDHLLKICLDIYLVREAKDFVLEQVSDFLYDILITPYVQKFLRSFYSRENLFYLNL